MQRLFRQNALYPNTPTLAGHARRVYPVPSSCLRNLTILCAIMLFCVSAPFIHATTVYKADGSVFEDVTNLQETDNYFLFKKEGEQLSLNKSRIRKIVNDEGETIYKTQALSVESFTTEEGHSGFIFFYNGEKVGTGYWNDEGLFVVGEDEIPDGTYKQFFDAGNIKRELAVKDNTLHGTCKTYYESGQIKRQAEFKQGRETGSSKLYYKSGDLKGVSQYKNGQKNGETKLFFPSGEVKSIFRYKGGRMHGIQKMFYPSGELKTRVMYKDGTKHGQIKQFYRDGTLQMKGKFTQGKLDGKAEFYNRDGQLTRTKQFKNGRVISSN